MNSHPAFLFCVTGNFVSYANSNLAIVYACALLRRARPQFTPSHKLSLLSLSFSPYPSNSLLLLLFRLSLYTRFYLNPPPTLSSLLSATRIARNYCPLGITRGINVAAQLTVDPLSPDLLTSVHSPPSIFCKTVALFFDFF